MATSLLSCSPLSVFPQTYLSDDRLLRSFELRSGSFPDDPALVKKEEPGTRQPTSRHVSSCVSTDCDTETVWSAGTRRADIQPRHTKERRGLESCITGGFFNGSKVSETLAQTYVHCQLYFDNGNRSRLLRSSELKGL